MERLRSLILYFINNFPRQLSRTEIVKLVYLFELEHINKYGYLFSNVTFIRHNYGPYAGEITRELTNLSMEEFITCMAYTTTHSSIGYAYTIGNNQKALSSQLSLKETGIANVLINKTNSLNLKDILDLAYQTPPMVHIIHDEQLGINWHGRVIPMNTKKSPKRFTKEQIVLARKRLHSVPDRGTQKEYFEDTMEVYKEYEDLRWRVSLCSIQS
jgi:uncharacterized protein YwgA